MCGDGGDQGNRWEGGTNNTTVTAAILLALDKAKMVQNCRQRLLECMMMGCHTHAPCLPTHVPCPPTYASCLPAHAASYIAILAFLSTNASSVPADMSTSQSKTFSPTYASTLHAHASNLSTQFASLPTHATSPTSLPTHLPSLTHVTHLP